MKIISMRNILYSAGSHGNFLKYLFDCYDAGKMLDIPFNDNGNSHNQQENKINRIYDFCNQYTYNKFKKESQVDNENYGIVWRGFHQFYYIIQCYIDRGAGLKQSGIELLEKNLLEYEKVYGVDVYISQSLKNNFNFDCAVQGQPPKQVLRNYFLLSFFTYFEHVCWKKNNEIINNNSKKINLEDMWDSKKLQENMFVIFCKKMDLQSVHEKFILRNKPLSQLRKVVRILEAIEKKENFEITDLNVISEAYILFVLECRHFDIPFLLGDNFFFDTKEIIEYVKFFPNYMKTPNNLFRINHKYFSRDKNVDL